MNKTFWFYIIFAIFIILFVWAIVLMEYPKRQITLCDGNKINGWPLNINTWQYNDNNIFIYIILTLCFMIFIYGCINAENNIIETYNKKNYYNIVNEVEIYRFIFVSIVKFIIISYLLYYYQHNILASLISNLFIAVLLFGLILLYSQIIIQDAWCIYPFFLIIIYFIYSDLYIINMNKNSKFIHNNI